jgi:tRNA modification GTPase
MDTIFAVASGGGRGALTVMRISGPASQSILESLCGDVPAPRRAVLRALRDSRRVLLDRALVLWLPGPGSYTGEDSAELHLHGGPAVTMGVAEALMALGAQPAEAGAFTRRAFLNGRMDLVEAEAVADLVAAETAAQRTQALRQMDGELGALYRGWAARLTHLLAGEEARIDFPDEAPADGAEAGGTEDLARLLAEIRAHLDDHGRGERLRDGLVFAVTGPPNVGKSSLVNALARSDVAIVSARPGTTRDVLHTRLELGGAVVTLLDTAGLRETEDEIEAEGVRRAVRSAAAADLVIAVRDSAGPAPMAVAAAHERVLHVINKVDLRPADDPHALAVSARTGIGMDRLREVLAQQAEALTQAEGPPALTRARHRAALQEAAARLDSARAADLPELRGEDIRLALRAIGRITGTVGVEDILDSVFRQFCIGK